MRFFSPTLYAAVLCAAILPAQASTVTYTFSMAQTAIGFVWVAPDFVTGTVAVPAGNLQSCAATIVGGCRTMVFTSYKALNGVDVSDGLEFGEGQGSLFYSFANLAFVTPGVYDELYYPGRATLRVVQNSDVPEPGSLALVLAGCGLAVGSSRRGLRSTAV